MGAQLELPTDDKQKAADFFAGASFVKLLDGASPEQRPTRAIWRLGQGVKDRDGEVLDPRGAVFPNHPIPVHYMHEGRKFAVGAVEKVEPDATGNLAHIVFNDDIPGFVEAFIVAEMVRKGRVTTGSIGFIPMSWKNANGQVQRREHGDAKPFPEKGRVYLEYDVTEQSIAPQAADITNALVAVKSYVRTMLADPEPKPDPPAPEETKSWYAKLGIASADKVGAVLNKGNMEKLTQIRDLAEQVLSSAKRAETGE